VRGLKSTSISRSRSWLGKRRNPTNTKLIHDPISAVAPYLVPLERATGQKLLLVFRNEFQGDVRNWHLDLLLGQVRVAHPGGTMRDDRHFQVGQDVTVRPAELLEDIGHV